MGQVPCDERPAPRRPRTSNEVTLAMITLTGALLLLIVPLAPAQPPVASAVVQPYGDENSESRTVFSTPVTLPANVSIPAAYDDLVEEMLRSSPTFRAQCSRLARASHLHVSLQRSLLAPPQSAVTRLVRHTDGRLDAEVEIGHVGDVVLLIAHEFEHIIEQLDDVNLAAMADRSGTGVHMDPATGHFETERAIAIGQRVAREASRAVARR